MRSEDVHPKYPREERSLPHWLFTNKLCYKKDKHSPVARATLKQPVLAFIKLFHGERCIGKLGLEFVPYFYRLCSVLSATC
jgi:hypothetical protein